MTLAMSWRVWCSAEHDEIEPDSRPQRALWVIIHQSLFHNNQPNMNLGSWGKQEMGGKGGIKEEREGEGGRGRKKVNGL